MRGYFGFRGDGKTLSLVADVYAEWVRDPNLIVFTNTPLSFGLHPKTKSPLIEYHWVSIDDLQGFFDFALTNPDSLIRRRSLILCDEANLVMPSRLFSSLPPFVLSFLAESRKLNTDIWFTTQHPARVDKVLRELTEDWVRCWRIPLLGIVRQQRLVLSPEGSLIEDLGVSWLVFKRRYYKFYNTFHIVGMDSKLMPTRQRSKIWDFIESAYSGGPSASESEKRLTISDYLYFDLSALFRKGVPDAEKPEMPFTQKAIKADLPKTAP